MCKGFTMLTLQHVIEVMDLLLQHGHLFVQLSTPEITPAGGRTVRCQGKQKPPLFRAHLRSSPPAFSPSALSFSSAASSAAILSLRAPLSASVLSSSLCSSSTRWPLSSARFSACCRRSDCSASRTPLSSDSACEKKTPQSITLVFICLFLLFEVPCSNHVV